MLYDHYLWIDDIDRVICGLPELNYLDGKTMLITGATGLICSAVVDILFRYNDLYNKKIKIVAAGRSETRIHARFGKMVERDDFSFVKFEASKDGNQIDIDADYIIHGASNAFPSIVMKEPVETMMSNILGLKSLLDYANTKKAKRLLYISSSEVYGKNKSNQPFTENEYGYVDLLDPRNSYPMGKRAAETLCIAYGLEYGVDTVIIRPGHIFGPTASPKDTRVSSMWAYKAANGENIVMKSEGLQIRSYCYCLDCAAAIIKVLLKGESFKAYNISNPDSVITIKELANTIAESANVHVEKHIPNQDEIKAFNPMENSSLDANSLLALGWKGCFDAKEGIEHTIILLKTSV